jgi:hypothetical protein
MLLSAFPTPARAASGTVRDWTHIWEVVALLGAGPQPPTHPQVYLLGGSAALCATQGESQWRAQLVARGAPDDVQAWTLVSHRQSFGQDEQVVAQLPSRAGFPARDVVLIGVGLSRFTQPPTPMKPATISRIPQSAADLHSWRHHRDLRPLSAAAKDDLVSYWLKQRYKLFQKYLSADLASLERIVTTCQERNLNPMLIDLPVNLAAAHGRLDKARSIYRSRCAAIAHKYGIKYVSFVRTIKMPNVWFYDLQHLLHPGQAKWQLWMARAVVPLISRK